MSKASPTHLMLYDLHQTVAPQSYLEPPPAVSSVWIWPLTMCPPLSKSTWSRCDCLWATLVSSYAVVTCGFSCEIGLRIAAVLISRPTRFSPRSIVPQATDIEHRSIRFVGIDQSNPNQLSLICTFCPPTFGYFQNDRKMHTLFQFRPYQMQMNQYMQYIHQNTI